MKYGDGLWEKSDVGWYTHPVHGGVCYERDGYWHFWPMNGEVGKSHSRYKTLREAIDTITRSFPLRATALEAEQDQSDYHSTRMTTPTPEERQKRIDERIQLAIESLNRVIRNHERMLGTASCMDIGGPIRVLYEVREELAHREQEHQEAVRELQYDVQLQKDLASRQRHAHAEEIRKAKEEGFRVGVLHKSECNLSPLVSDPQHYACSPFADTSQKSSTPTDQSA